MDDAEFYPEHRKVIQYVQFADDKDADGHGTHVAGIAAGKVKTSALFRVAQPRARVLLLLVFCRFVFHRGGGDFCNGVHIARRQT